jgi:hypothetical protein
VSMDPQLDRPGGRGPAEQRSCVWVSGLAGLRGQACGVDIVQAWRARPSGMEIVLVCISGAGLGGMARQSRDRAGLCRPDCMAWQRSEMFVDPRLGRS